MVKPQSQNVHKLLQKIVTSLLGDGLFLCAL